MQNDDKWGYVTMNGKFERGTFSDRETDAIVQNLKDAGCSAGTISNFMEDIESGKMAEGLKLLAVHRRSLLNHLHEEQKRIDCLDYLVWQMEKPKGKTKKDRI